MRIVRLLAAGVLVVALAATVDAGTGTAAPSAPPSAPPPVACPDGQGIEVTGTIAEDLAGADGHGTLTPAGGSYGAGCAANDEPDDGWPSTALPAPPQVDPDADDENDPFDRAAGLYLGYQFDRLPDYWEQPIAFRAANAALISGSWAGGIAYTLSEFGWGDGSDARRKVEETLPSGPGCRWHGPVAAREMPGRLSSYAGTVRAVYKYDHVPMRIGSRKFARAPGGWFHYLCGAATPSGITGPAIGSHLTDVEADYYLTPHWVYAVGVSAAQLTDVAPLVRAARGQVDATVLTSPADRSVVGLRNWMWSAARRYEVDLGGRRATIVPTGIRVVAPGVPLVAHDLRAGGCATGGTPDTGDPAGETDCWFRFTRANAPGDYYTVGFALRWEIRLPGTPPLTFWTTRTQNYTTGEVQAPTN